MLNIWLYSIISVLIVSLISLIGIVTLSLKKESLHKLLIFMISFSAGALLGDALIHLLPEAVKESGFTLMVSLYVLSGIGFSLITEKIIHLGHGPHTTLEAHPHHISKMNIIGDSIHNFIDGLIIATSYIVSIPIGIATTIAVIFHEIPHELGNFGVLVYAGFSRKKAILTNFLIALTSLAGALIALSIGTTSPNLLIFLIPFAAGNFIYIACSDLIPELHKDTKLSRSIIQIIFFIIGILIMALMLLLE